jgi:hypothetical protein
MEFIFLLGIKSSLRWTGNILEKILLVSEYCITCGVCNYA